MKLKGFEGLGVLKSAHDEEKSSGGSLFGSERELCEAVLSLDSSTVLDQQIEYLRKLGFNAEKTSTGAVKVSKTKGKKGSQTLAPKQVLDFLKARAKEFLPQVQSVATNKYPPTPIVPRPIATKDKPKVSKTTSTPEVNPLSHSKKGKESREVRNDPSMDYIFPEFTSDVLTFLKKIDDGTMNKEYLVKRCKEILALNGFVVKDRNGRFTITKETRDGVVRESKRMTKDELIALLRGRVADQLGELVEVRKNGSGSNREDEESSDTKPQQATTNTKKPSQKQQRVRRPSIRLYQDTEKARNDKNIYVGQLIAMDDATKPHAEVANDVSYEFKRPIDIEDAVIVEPSPANSKSEDMPEEEALHDIDTTEVQNPFKLSREVREKFTREMGHLQYDAVSGEERKDSAVNVKKENSSNKESEKTRIYAHYDEDPKVRVVEKMINELQGKDSGDNRKYIEWAQWDTFVRRFPEKATTYAEQGHEGIKNALRRLSREKGTPKTGADAGGPPSSPEPKEEQPKSDFFDTRFQTEFGIKKEELLSIEGFEKLSEGQQRLVFENFTQLTLGNVREEASQLVSEKVVEQRSRMVASLGRIFGNALSGAREVFGSARAQFKAEKEVAGRMRTGGFDEHKELLTELVQGVSEYGPRVHIEKGELVIDLVNIRERARNKEIRDEEWFAMKDLNEVAHQFARIPAEWRGQTLGVDTEESKLMRFVKERILKNKDRVNQTVYAEQEKKYNEAKEVLESVLKKKGWSELQIANELIEIDSRVHQLQMLQTNQNALEALADIEDKEFWKETLKSFAKGPGAYMALGLVGRTVAGATLGFIGAPLVAAGVGSLRSWNRTEAELRERDRNERAGVSNPRLVQLEGAIQAIKETKPEKRTKEQNEILEKYQKEFDEISAQSLNIVSAKAEITGSVTKEVSQVGITDKLENLLTRCRDARGKKEEVRLLAQLRARVEYVHDKHKLQRISYGEREGMVTRQMELLTALGNATAYLVSNELTMNAGTETKYISKSFSASEVTQKLREKSERRLKKQLTKAEEIIIESRRKGRKDDLIRSAEKAAAFSLAGYLAADYFMGSRGGAQVEGGNVQPRSEQPATPASPRSPESTSSTPVPVSPDSNAQVEKGGDTLNRPHTAERLDGGEYLIQRGDNLTKIFKEQIPSIMKMGAGQAQENAIANIFKSLTPEELSRIGVRSGNIDLIYTGENINMEELSKIIE